MVLGEGVVGQSFLENTVPAGQGVAAMLGSHSEQSANSDVFGDWGESVVEVDALFHELTFDHHSCFVLV